MKKLLLFALLTLSTLSGWAVTDGQQYASVNGINVKNLWMFDRVHARNAYTSSPICNTNARTATIEEIKIDDDTANLLMELLLNESGWDNKTRINIV